MKGLIGWCKITRYDLYGMAMERRGTSIPYSDYYLERTQFGRARKEPLRFF